MDTAGRVVVLRRLYGAASSSSCSGAVERCGVGNRSCHPADDDGGGRVPGDPAGAVACDHGVVRGVGAWRVVVSLLAVFFCPFLCHALQVHLLLSTAAAGLA